MKTLSADVAIIGAGTAGMGAFRAARAHTKNVVLIESGPYGTTCARVGCMPSKLLIAAAEAAHRAHEAPVFGVHPGPVRIDGRQVMQRVRSERDRFVGFVVETIDDWPDEAKIRGRARFIAPGKHIGVHPKALLEYDRQDAATKAKIDARIAGYASPVEFYVERLKEGIATITASVAPNPVIVRLSDFKSNEYANLIGGSKYEPHEENPMIGFRGASRYIDPSFREAFALECRAVKLVRETMGLDNLWVMIPFVRTLDEGRKVLEVLAENGLKQGVNGLKVIMMCEVPSNALLADEFLELFDGFSIGSNDMTQLTLGLDRDSAIVAGLFDERDPAVKKMLSMAIQAARAKGKYVGICGQGPSDHPDLAQWLMEQGIESVSLNPDTVVDTWLALAKSKG